MSDDPGVAGMDFFDAHCHLQDARLVRSGWETTPGLPQIAAQVVNGTGPDDWGAVRECASIGTGRILRAYGVHPWKVGNLPKNWEEQLRGFLKSGAVSIGEIGLDNWIEPRDPDLQREVFLRQLEICSELRLPPSIHCVRAWGVLLDCLGSGPELETGFLVHGFSGSIEVLDQLLDLGGSVSFSAYGAHPGRSSIRKAVRRCPVDRILAETDAPDMVPLEECCCFSILDGQGHRLHHPAEISTAYRYLAEWRKESPVQLMERISDNFRRLFGGPSAN